MVAWSTLSLFLLAVLVLMLSPGPNMAFVLSHGMALGRGAGWPRRWALPPPTWC